MSDKTLPHDVTAVTPAILMRLAEGLLAGGTAMAIFSPDDQLHFATEGLVALYDVQPGPQTFSSMITHAWKAGVGPLIETDDIDAWLAMANTKRRSKPVRQFEVDMIDGRWLWISETTLTGGWIVLSVADFTSVKRKEFRLTSDRDAAIIAAETDHLTGLYARGATMTRLTHLVERAFSSGETFCAVLIDLDHFKSINDRFGHDGGDQVLVHFSSCALQVMRDRDIIGRVGGEEFLVVMPGATAEQAGAVVERLQSFLRDQRLVVGGVTLRYTFSAGIAQWGKGKTLDSLYREADQALYAAKRGGRNLIRQAS